MQHYKKERLWFLLAIIMVGSLTLTSCVDNQDNPSGGGSSGDKDRKYVERLYPLLTRNKNL